MNDLLVFADILLPALVAGLLVISTHIPLGFKVLSRGIIFMDLAIAQVAGLGALLVTVLVGEAAPAGADPAGRRPTGTGGRPATAALRKTDAALSGTLDRYAVCVGGNRRHADSGG